MELKNIKYSNILDIKEFENVKEVSILYDMGNAEEIISKDNFIIQINITAYNQNAINNNHINLVEGRFPQNNSELIISKKANLDTCVGQEIELTLNGITQRYTIVGIAERLNNDQNLELFHIVVGALAYYDDKSIETDANVDVSILTNNIRNVYVTVNKLINNFKLYGSEQEAEKNIKYNKTLLNYSLVSNYNATEVTEPNVDFISITEVNSQEFGMDLIKIISIIVIIIMTISIILIYTTFSMTYNERIKEIGKLSAIGMSRKQIRSMLIKENSILSIIGIIIGEIIGIAISYLTINLLNILIKNQIASTVGSKILIDPNIKMYIVITIGIIGITAMMVYIIVFLAGILPIKKLNRITQINAINNTNDLKIQKVKKSRIIEKIFKQEGVLAYKNIKKNKFKYNALTISISISIIIFFIINNIVELLGGYITDYSNYKEYEIILDYSNTNSEKIINTLKDAKLIDGYMKISWTAMNCSTIKSKMSKEILEDNKNYSQIRLVALEGEEYSKLLNSLELTELEENQCILVDTIFDVKNGREIRSTEFDIGDNIILENIKQEKELNDSSIEEREMLNEIQKQLGVEETKSTSYEETKSTSYEETLRHKLEIVGIAKENFGNMTELTVNVSVPVILVINKETLTNLGQQFISDYIYIDTSQPYEIDNTLENIDINFIKINLYAQIESHINMWLIIHFLAYSFMIIITILNIINIFNIIYSSLNLREREFAILKSIGMNNKQIKRMLNLEGIFYGFKGILIGIVISILLIYIVHLGTMDNTLDTFQIPIMQIVITTIIVYFIIFIATYKGKNKIKINNIVQKIKNENI